MRRSKQQALLFLFGAVLVGGALGFSAERILGAGRRCTTSEQEYRTRFYDQLELSVAQRATVDSILDERHRQRAAALKPLQPRLDSIRENARTQIRLVLTDEQRARFEQFLAAKSAVQQNKD